MTKTSKQVVDIVTRSQHSVGSSSNTFGGPDRYVAAVVRPADSEPVGTHPLSTHNIRRYGWEVISCGEGYSRHTGPRSMYGMAVARAEQIKAEIEGAEGR